MRKGIVTLFILSFACSEAEPPFNLQERGAHLEGEKSSYGTLLGSFNGVEVHSNGSTGHNSNEYDSVGLKYQCVHYINKYIHEVYGHRSLVHTGHAKSYFRTAEAKGLLPFENGGDTAPQVGDIVVSERGDYGHVAIIRFVGNDHIRIVQQNWSNNANDLDKRIEMNISGGRYTLSGFSQNYPIRGWLRTPNAGNPHPGPSQTESCLISARDDVTYIEESESCFERGGSPNYWRDFDGEDDEHAYYTYTTDDENFDNFGKFHLDFEETGLYKFAVFIPNMDGLSNQARYKLWFNGEVHYVTINQDEHRGGYALLGEFQVAAEGQAVRLDDNTGEPYLRSGSPRLAYDTLRITRSDYEMGCSLGGCSSEEPEEPTPDAALAPDTEPPSEDAPSGDEVESADGGLSQDEADSSGGCQLSLGAKERLPIWLLLLLPLINIYRHRGQGEAA